MNPPELADTRKHREPGTAAVRKFMVQIPPGLRKVHPSMWKTEFWVCVVVLYMFIEEELKTLLHYGLKVYSSKLEF